MQSGDLEKDPRPSQVYSNDNGTTFDTNQVDIKREAFSPVENYPNFDDK